MQPYKWTTFKHAGDTDKAGLLRSNLVIDVPDLLKFDEKLFHLRVFNADYRYGAVEFETLRDPARDDSLSKSGLRQPSGGVLPASRVVQEIPVSSEQWMPRSTSEPALASPCGEVVPS